MDKLEPLEFDRQPLEMKLKKRSSKRTMKKHKLVSGITKKDRMDLKKWEKKIIALNKKINEQIKNKKSCKKQPLAVTFEKAKRMKLSRKKRGARKPKATADGVAAAATGAVAAAEETPVQEETPTPTPTENTPVENSTPEESKEEKSESEESPASAPEPAPEPNESTPKEETPKEEESGSVLSSVTEGVKSAAESVGLTSKPEEEKTVGGRAKKGKGKKGKKGKWV